MTTTKNKLERSTAVMALKQRNEQNFRNLGLLTPNFTIKFAYVPKHREDMVVSMFPSEMEGGEDIYMELTDGNNYPLHEQPVLYKLRHNPYYKQGEYEVIPPDPSRNKNAETYLVPISELEVVSGKAATTQVEKPIAATPAKKPMISTSIISEDSGFQKEKEDAHYSELTIRDLAAILLKSPVSNKKWLNNLINTNK